METITLKVGDKLQALVHEPFSAPIPKGAIVKIVGFGRSNDESEERVTHHWAAPMVKYRGGTWYTNVVDLFKKYKKVGK